MRTDTRNKALTIALVEAGRKHRDVADAIGISRGLFSSICTGRVEPSSRVKQLIADELGLNVDELFDDDERVPA